MEQASPELFEAIIAKDTWGAQEHRALLSYLYSTSDASRRVREIVSQLESQSAQAKGAAAVKLGIARFMVCRFNDALAALSAGGDGKECAYFQAQCHKSLRQYGKATTLLEKARERGWSGDEIELELAEVKALDGKLEEAATILAKLQNRVGDKADFMYVRGLIDELAGRRTQAAQAFQQARQIDPNHGAATFRLAYHYDLHGDEEQAINLYKQCLAKPPVYTGALMNLAILYEDAGRYDQAVSCLKRVLAVNPGHLRAQLFLKDAQAAQFMFYDEDQAKRVAKRNAVLDIPVTDFELSVRARNCLKKMNVHSLGDLVATTELELLSYKNFGETSLKEIKDMLSAKGLRLGQAADEGPELIPMRLATPELDSTPSAGMGGNTLLETPLAQIEFSVRARRALESLDVKTLGDLVAHSETDLLGCKNFGQTSLDEIRQRLSEHGLTLRDSN